MIVVIKLLTVMCDKGFSLKHYLKSHMRKHNDEKPFNCDVCGRDFKRPSELKSHMINHTMINLIPLTYVVNYLLKDVTDGCT